MDYAVNGSVGYIEEFKKMVYDDGWYKEASPGYHYFPLKALLQTANAARACGIDLYNEKLKSMLTGVVKAMYPNMTFPAHNDGGYMSDISNQDFLYEMGYSRFKDPFILQILAKVYATKDRNSALALLTNVDIKPDKTPLKQDSYLFDDTGIAILRSGDNTLVFRYGFSDGGHSHPGFRLRYTMERKRFLPIAERIVMHNRPIWDGKSGDCLIISCWSTAKICRSGELRLPVVYYRSIPIKTGELLPLYWIIMVIPE